MQWHMRVAHMQWEQAASYRKIFVHTQHKIHKIGSRATPVRSCTSKIYRY